MDGMRMPRGGVRIEWECNKQEMGNMEYSVDVCTHRDHQIVTVHVIAMEKME